MTVLHALRKEHWVRMATVMTLLLIGASIILFVENVLISLVLAFVLSYLISPAVIAFERMGMSRTVAVALPFVALLVAVALGIYFLIPILNEQILVLQDESPRLKSGILGLITDLETHLITRWKVADPRLAEKARALILNQSHTLSNSALKFISASFTVSFLTPLIAYFMLVDGRKTVRLLLSLVPNSLFELFLNLFHQINHQMGGFVRARLLESLMVGGCVGVGLFVFNFPYAFILALIAAATNLIPYVGPFIGAIPAVLVIFLSKKVPEFNPHGMIFFVVGGTYLLAQLIDMFLIIPLVVARIVNLHPLLVILSIIIGAEALGVLGMIISIPIASALKLIGTSVYQHLVHFRT